MNLFQAVSIVFAGMSLQTSAFALTCQGRISGGQSVIVDIPTDMNPARVLDINFIDTRTGNPTQAGLKFTSSWTKTASGQSITTAKNRDITAILSVSSRGNGVLQIDVKKGSKSAPERVRYNVTCHAAATP